MTDPLVLKSPSNQSNILDFNFICCDVFLVLSLIKLLPLLIAGLILLQVSLGGTKKRSFMAK
jgi:hypothetical protein